MNKHTGESSDNTAQHGAALLSMANGEGKAEAHGRYSVSLIGPVEHLRARYVELQERLSAKGLKARIDRLLNGARMLSELMSIPLEQKWAEEFENVVTTVGKNFALDTFLAGSAYTVTGPYIGLINGSASSAVAGDTMASHAAWLEVGNTNGPQVKYPNSGGSTVRATAAWSAAASGSKSLSASATFYISGITGGTTIGGCFLVLGSGALNTVDNTGGTLYSAGAFTGGSKTVAIGDTLSVSYTASL